MYRRLLLPTLIAFAALAAPAGAFTVGSGSLTWNQANVFAGNCNATNANCTFLGYLTQPGTPGVINGRPGGQVFTQAPATGGPVTPTSPRNGEVYGFSFPGKSTGTYDPATKTGSIEFDGLIKFEAPVGGDPDDNQTGPFGGPESAATIDDPQIVFDGTNIAKLYGSGTTSDGLPYDRSQPIFNLTLDPAKITQTGATVQIRDAYPRIATPNYVFKLGFSTADRNPPSYGLMDLTVRAAPPAITVTPVADLDPNGQTVTVSGTGATTENTGLYVYLSPQSASFTDQNGAANPPAFSFVRNATFGPGGSFTTTITARSPFTTGGGSVDCALVPCGVRTIAAHFVADRSQDTFTPVSFRQAPYTVPTPTPTPTVTVSPTPYYNPPKPKKPRLTAIKLKRKKVSFTLSKKARVTGSIKRKGKFKGKKVKRSVKVNAKRGRNAKKIRKLPRGRYTVKLKPKGGVAKTKKVRLK